MEEKAKNLPVTPCWVLIAMYLKFLNWNLFCTSLLEINFHIALKFSITTDQTIQALNFPRQLQGKATIYKIEENLLKSGSKVAFLNLRILETCTILEWLCLQILIFVKLMYLRDVRLKGTRKPSKVASMRWAV